MQDILEKKLKDKKKFEPVLIKIIDEGHENFWIRAFDEIWPVGKDLILAVETLMAVYVIFQYEFPPELSLFWDFLLHLVGRKSPQQENKFLISRLLESIKVSEEDNPEKENEPEAASNAS